MVFLVTNVLCVMLVIAIHEGGHYYIARRVGIVPPAFAIGMGPTVLWFDYSGTRFSLRLLPIGGFVRFLPGQIESLTDSRRIAILLAGPGANLVLALGVSVLLITSGFVPRVFAEHQVSFLVQIPLALLGTIVLFFVSVPLTIYAIVMLLLHPIAQMSMVSGPVGILSGTAIPPEVLAPLPLWQQAFMIIYFMSLGIGSFNLVPISMLDGGQILLRLTNRWPRFGKVWLVSTTGILVSLALYLITTDVYKIIWH